MSADGYNIEVMKKSQSHNSVNIQNVLKEMRKIGDGIERRLGVKIEAVEHKVDLLAENQVGMREKLNATFEMAGKSAENLTIVKDNVEFIKHDLKKKVGVEKFVALER